MSNEASWTQLGAALTATLHKPRVHLSDLLLQIASAEYPSLDPLHVDAQIERLALRVRSACDALPPGGSHADHPGDSDPEAGDLRDRQLAAIRHVVFTQDGFRGDTEDYYNPENSYLNRVLQRRVGVPILLSCLLLEIGRRAGIPLAGVAFPGHFLVRTASNVSPTILDPFDRGRILTPTDLQALLDRNHARAPRFHPTMLVTASAHTIVVRVLRNLKGAYIRRSDFASARNVTEALVAIHTDDPNEWWDRGRIHLQLHQPLRALEDFRRCIATAPPGPLRKEAEAALQSVREVLVRRN
ncbi:MAG: transglutaminase family protein [Candidatus Eisenbacteria bacterium]|nr:transglutaminase family protein [Candidatus Eisenbacteria bacterium]